MRILASRLVFAAALVASPLAAHAQSAAVLVLKADDVIVSIAPKHRLVISAKGAVRSGGWSQPQLRAGKPGDDPHTLVFDLVATPPPKNAIVIEAIMPVQASETIAMPPLSITQIKVNSETGGATATINR